LANAYSKGSYDKRHKPLVINAGDKVFIRLYYGYYIPEA